MIYVLISISVFLLMVLLQLVLHRFLLARGIVSFHTFWIFVVGGIADLIFIRHLSLSVVPDTTLWYYPLPLSGLMVYVACCIDWAILSSSPILGDESPSTKIVHFLSVFGVGRKQQLINLFSQDALIDKRLRHMETTGWVKKIQGRYVAIGSGKRIATVLRWYRALLRMEVTG